jgi:hypothetical protein
VTASDDVAEEAGEEALSVWREALSEPLLAVHAILDHHGEAVGCCPAAASVKCA